MTLWTYVIAGILALHGLGHAGGPWFMRRSWIAPRITNSPARWLFIGEWFAAGILFVIAALSLMGILNSTLPPKAWRAVAVLGALLSGQPAVMYANAHDGRPLFNAITVDFAVLFALLLFDWPPLSLVGA